MILWLLTNIPSLLGGILTAINKAQDNALEKFKIGELTGRDVSIALVKGEIARNNALRDVNIAGMNHPIYWVAWFLFVMPVALYHACIFWVSIFPGLGWTILKVPPDQIAFAQVIVLSMFGLGAANSMMTTIMNRWTR